MRYLLLLAIPACGHPGYPYEQVDYRYGIEDGTPTSGERGNIHIQEIGWAGSVSNDGTWDPTDVFIEFRNMGSLPVNLTNWQIQMEGDREITWLIPEHSGKIEVGDRFVIAAKNSGCFPSPDVLIPELSFPPYGGSFALTLVDADERLIEGAGSRDMEPYSGGYDTRVVRSMERINVMFGGRGNEPNSWYYYQRKPCPAGVPGVDLNCWEDIPNNDLVAESCRKRTLASPGRANSEDYTGAFSAGGND